MTKRKKNRERKLTDAEMAAILYGEAQSQKMLRNAMQSIHGEGWRGEPDWLIGIREVAQGAINEYYGKHD